MLPVKASALIRVFVPERETKIIYSGSAICSDGFLLKKEKVLNLDLEQYEQLVVNNKLTVLVEIEDKLSFQSKLFIPKEK